MKYRFGLSGIILSLCAAVAVPAQAQEFYGPLRNRDMGPVGFSRLHMLPDHAVAPKDGRWGFELHFSHSNTFAMDEETLDYLEARGGRQSLTAQDVQNIQALPGDTYLFDGAVNLTQFTVHYGVTDRWSVYASLPYYKLDGGGLDRVIENFHDTFGFDAFGRDFLPRNQVNAVVSLAGQEIVLLDAPALSGTGDPVFGVRYHHRIDEDDAISVELAHKRVIQDPKFFRTTGSDDTGLQVSWHHFQGNLATYVNGSIVRIGSANPFPRNTRHVLPKINVAWEYRMTPRSNLVFQLNGQKSLFRNGADPEVSANVYQASLGVRQRYGRLVWSYALTENLVNFNNTADLGFHIGLAWTVDTR